MTTKNIFIITVLIYLISLSTFAQGPAGYTKCEPEQNFTEPTNVAFGNAGSYKYLFNQIGPFLFANHPFFGGPSGASVTRYWCQTISEMDVATPSAKLAAAFTALKNHINGSDILTAQQILDQNSIVQQNISAIGIEKDIIIQAFDLVDTYETVLGPLFTNEGGKEYPRDQKTGKEIHYALMYIQDAIMRTYCSARLEEFPDVYKGAMFKTSEHFPGKVAPPADPSNVYQVKVNASQAPNWGTPIYFHRDIPARRPTGTYVAPGTIVKIKVPTSVVGKGYTIRAGTHYWDLKYRDKIRRLDRATIIYPVIKEEITVGSPLGGNIYFEVPEGLDEGEITLEITGAVRSPFFSAKNSHKTTLAEWQNIERKHPGAWADFESDKILFQVPTTWIYAFDDPVTMMENWDIAMDAVNDLLGKPRLHGTHTMFRQVDIIMRVGFGAPGYPMVNTTYNPASPTNGKGTNNIFKGPQYQTWQIFHELGHSHVPSFFIGEIESIVNLLSVAVANDGFGMSLDSAFAWSIDNRYDLTLDIIANFWMITENFRKNRIMSGEEMMYQHRGHAKYVDVARLFGWDVLNRFYKKINEDYNNGLVIPKTNHPIDDRILRMSIAAGADLRPLLHFWGRRPLNFDGLADFLLQLTNCLPLSASTMHLNTTKL